MVRQQHGIRKNRCLKAWPAPPAPSVGTWSPCLPVCAAPCSHYLLEQDHTAPSFSMHTAFTHVVPSPWHTRSIVHLAHSYSLRQIKCLLPLPSPSWLLDPWKPLPPFCSFPHRSTCTCSAYRSDSPYRLQASVGRNHVIFILVCSDLAQYLVQKKSLTNVSWMNIYLYSWPLNSMALNGRGLFTHGFFFNKYCWFSYDFFQ